ncbi:Alpha/Beta hydrolase protein [Kockovaella imperatae]|uniref:Proline iminopeptidase n=1 Tax=Kockovaella imperatae TaxID=4999 RepID=A0A1Y1UTA3_9TREE|nr:Alpha/Beta hydrolase protein [Kockovaella imperatae]ORX41253.1 Alpha/Beta hydrolase protein [Kockovaella imperatae]
MPYDPVKPYHEDYIKVSDLHTLYYMQCGNPEGKPVVFLHGGPGGSVGESDTVFFNPDIYRVILFTQRGAGKSKPIGERRENTTWDLVDDIEKIRKLLKIETWLVFGGSWGSTLALAYAQTHPEQVTGLILRGIYTIRDEESEFLWLTGAKNFYPDEWKAFASLVPEHRRTSMTEFAKAYKELFDNPDDSISLNAAKAWSRYESQVSRLVPDPKSIAQADHDLDWARSFALIECHYALNHGFMPHGHLLSEAQIAKIRHIPCVIVQGRYDVVCPPYTAYELRDVYGDKLTLHVVSEGGHSPKEPAMCAQLTKVMDEFKGL